MNEKYRTQCLSRMAQHVFPMIGALPITEITIPDVVRAVEKIGKRGTVETAKRMKQIISQTFRYASQRGLGEKEFVFFSAASKAKHISNGTVLMALRRMGYKNRMTGHGFRTLASTILNEKHYPPDVIERQLAHEDSDKIRAAYNRAEYLLERKKMTKDYADYLDALSSQRADKVVKLKKCN